MKREPTHVDLTKEPLFADVIARPDDVEPRLVLADRLIERGDPRGEFIQLQCTRDRTSEGAVAESLRKKEETLLRKYRKVWNAPFKDGVRSTTFFRGFAEYAVGEAAKMIPVVDTIVRHTPLRTLAVTAFKKGDAQRLAECRGLLRLRALDVSQQRMDLDAARALFDSPNLASIRELRPWGNRFGDDGLAILCRSASLAELLHLQLAHLDIHRAGIEALAEARFVSTIEHLDLAYNREVDALAFEPLTRAPLTSLKKLSLATCPIGDEGAEALAASPHLGKLEEIHARVCGIGPRGALALARSKTLRSLRRLEVEDHRMRLPQEVAAELHARFGG